MASIKQIAAIALTLIIAVPIIMGYAFASTEETSTSWQTSSTSNATDLTLNHQTPYYSEFIGPENNAQLLQKQYYTLQAVTEWHTVQPDYVSTSGNYSSLPVQTTATQSLSLSSTQADYGNVQYIAAGEKYGSSSDYDYTMTNTGKPLYYYTLGTDYTGLHWALICDGNTVQYGPTFMYAMRDSDSTWTIYSTDINGDIYVASGISTWYFMGDVQIRLICTYQEATTLTSADAYSYVTSGPTAIQINYNDSTTGYAAVTDTQTVTWSTDGTASVAGTEYTNVASLGFAAGPDVSIIYYDEITYSTTEFADASAGWTLPTVSDAATYDWWTNNQLNSEVRMMASFTSSGYAYLGPVATTDDDYTIELHYDGSKMYVTDETSSTTYTLGSYSKVMVVMGLEYATVYGISSWPTIGVYPATFNEVVVDYPDLEPFTYVTLSNVDSDVVFRVDRCEAVAGYFPSTYNCTLSFADKYPAQSLTFTLKSIALYGDSVSFGGTSFTVTDGKISGTDSSGETFTVTLRGAVVRYVYGDSGYTVSVGGHELTGTAGTVYFGGEWSLTSSISLISQTTSTQQVWAPGEFAFDKEDFAACGLLVAGACLVGLGMTGSRSGIKMGVLLMICGGAGLIYLTLI